MKIGVFHSTRHRRADGCIRLLTFEDSERHGYVNRDAPTID